MNGDVTDWTELREFKAVDLTASFVLSWTFERGTLLIDVDLCLQPEHAFYEPPRPAERACIRPAVLEFPDCERLEADDDGERPPPGDVAAGLGHGRLLGLKRVGDGVYRIDGEFGVVVVHAGRPLLRLRMLAP